MKTDLNSILTENSRRLHEQAAAALYDPLTGQGATGQRRRVVSPWVDSPLWLPQTMLDDPDYRLITSRTRFEMLRLRHDFEYWAARCVTIKHKLTCRRIPFILNRPQRRVLEQLEQERLGGRPIRLILLKARQWGGSTLIQMYMAWIQCVLRRSWSSIICAHVKDTASSIRGMYSSMLASYPPDLWDEEEAPAFRPYEGAANTRFIAGRDCRVTLASSFAQEAVRGLDYAMAHLTEVAFWNSTDQMSPADFVRAVCGGVALEPLTIIAIESTANGVDNFFHSEWLRSRAGDSAMIPVFVPWYEIEIYRSDLPDPAALVASMDKYEWTLWERGLTLNQIAWYHNKRREFNTHTRMMAEYPSDDVEAFSATGSGVFSSEQIERLRLGCSELPAMRGELVGAAVVGAEALRSLHFVADEASGPLLLWRMPPETPAPRNRYVVAVDIGGRAASSDWSVITVLDRGAQPCPEVVAQWRGHVDHDILAWHAAAMARWYDDALLVIESNTLESAGDASSQFILEELNGVYPNLYYRVSRDTLRPGFEQRPGFHTNRATKAAAIATLIAAVRDSSYIERCNDACNEMATYEQQPNGAYAAKRGFHDDILMTRAIALYVAAGLPPLSASDASEMEFFHNPPASWL